MKLPRVSAAYNPNREAQRNQVIERADQGNHKRESDVEIGNGRLILTAPDGGRWELTVDNAGNLSTTSA